MKRLRDILTTGKNKTRKNSAPSNAEDQRDIGKKTRADNPISILSDDTLGRAPAALAFGEEILGLDWGEGIVVGVLGAWGSGKTSFINLARGNLENTSIAVIDFNPWMFSGAEQLLQSFFGELAAQLRVRRSLGDVAETIENYGDAFSAFTWLPVIGPWVARGGAATKLFKTIAERRKSGIGTMRAKVEKALASLQKPVIVILDDVDRLSTQEIREVFKLIRLVARFPNVIYIVAFDRTRVEEALTQEGVPGKDYLEKILQLAIDLPAVPAALIRSQVLSAIEESLSDFENPGPFDTSRWPDVFEEVIRPLIRNMRDVRRYAASIRMAVRRLRGQISIVDVLALEAIRTFLPAVYLQILNSVDGLTTASNTGLSRQAEPPYLKESIEHLIEVSGNQAEVIRRMILRLFPAAARHIGGSHFGADWYAHWLRDRRVAHQEVLRLYLESVAGTGFKAFTDAESAFALMHDKKAFDSFLRSLDSDRLETVISSLEIFEDKIPPEKVVPGVTVLLNLMSDVPSTTQSLWIPRPGFIVGRVAYRLLRTLNAADAIESATREILPEVRTLSSKLALITFVGYRENAGHKLISEISASQFEKNWRAEVRAASAEELAKEIDLLQVLGVAKREASSEESTLEIPDVPELTLALLKNAQTEVKSFAFGSRALHHSPRLHWGSLTDLFGSEQELNRRIEQARNISSKEDSELFALVDRYLGGWRPDVDD
ncbi:MAG: NTPase KAP [Bacteroidetes bacterium]|nr:MAG: NTPase KAP [Bacteroidota bacterium]